MLCRTPLPLLLAATGLTWLAAGCSPQTSAADPDSTGIGVKEREVPPVRVTPIERREMVQILETTSKLESEGEIRLFPRIPGEVFEILAEEGDSVKCGDMLARLDDRDEKLAVRDAEVALKEAHDRLLLAELAVEEAEAQTESAGHAARQAERDYQRDLRLRDSTEVASPVSEQALEARLLERDRALNEEAQAKIRARRTKQEVESAKTAIDRAQVALEVANLTLEKKHITAPFDGVIAERLCRLGDSAGTGEHAFILTDTQVLRAVFSRPQEELELFTQSGKSNGKGRLALTATAEAFPGRVFEGWVERISPTIEADSGQFRVTARLQSLEEGAPLLPGMLVRMEIVTDRHTEALVVPKRALRREGERRYVLVVDNQEGDDVVRRVNVTEGYSDDENVEILPEEEDGLTGDERVILVGSRDLAPGDPVRVEGDDDEPAPIDSGELPEADPAGESE